MPVTLHHGDCVTVLATLPAASVDAIVTDPPYELGFMGKAWDAAGVAYSVGLWAECLRVLKPGGHLLAFGGTRTYHRMTVAIEDAGFDIRDSVHWVYGSGFPKSLDVSKAIDKQRDDRADVYRVTAWVRERRDAAGIGNKDIDNAFGFAGMAGHWTSAKSQPAVPTLEQVPTLLDVLGVALDDVPDDIRRLMWELNGRKGQPGENWAKREVVGERSVPVGHAFAGPVYGGDSSAEVVSITAPATDAAREWEGWGTALKPAHEPIVVARKPLVGTVAANVLAHGTGALNIDASRVAHNEQCRMMSAQVNGLQNEKLRQGGRHKEVLELKPEGRWPANLVLTHAADCDDECTPACPIALLDEQSGERPPGRFPEGGKRSASSDNAYGISRGTEAPARVLTDSGGASRFFTVTGWDPVADVVPFRYVPKPAKRERNAGLDLLPERVGGSMTGAEYQPGEPTNDPVRQNFHPTVKPVALMRWLVRLVTPPGGVVLDPFAGSGTTLVAAVLERFDAVGIELTDDYLPIIRGRVAWAEQQTPTPAPERADTVTPVVEQQTLPW